MTSDITAQLDEDVHDLPSAVAALRTRLAHDWTGALPPQMQDAYQAAWAAAFVARLADVIAEAGDLEDRCESCGGVGEITHVLEQYDATRACYCCGGRGKNPSEKGHDLLMFLKRYGVRVPSLDWQDGVESDGEFEFDESGVPF